MTAFLDVVAPGAHSTVQDLGRQGYLDIGVPPSGALDPPSLRLANRLVGNQDTAAGLEILHAGPELIVRSESVRIALLGDGTSLEVLHPEPMTCPLGRSLTLPREARFRVTPLRGSACAYLAVAGGFDLVPCMGSLATYVRGGFGGFEGRPLQSGDALPLARSQAPDGPDFGLGKDLAIGRQDTTCIRVVLGPQDNLFTSTGIATFLNETFSVSQSSDRMGARLDGPRLELQDFENFISDGITAGAIQVPGSGQPIVLLADHQTSGGYPKIATVISADLPLLGRLRPGAALRFEPVVVEAAETARRNQERDLLALMASIGPADDSHQLDLQQLYASNLISGVVDGADSQD